METRVSEEVLRPVVERLVAEMIERFVRENELRVRELSLMERVVRVEEELKAIHKVLMVIQEAMEKRFEALQREMDKRFEAMEKANQARFEAIEKRLNFMQWFMGIGFTFIGVLVTVLNFLRG